MCDHLVQMNTFSKSKLLQTIFVQIVRILYRKGIGLPPLLGRIPLGFGEA
jgi:hypothetical protein